MPRTEGYAGYISGRAEAAVINLSSNNVFENNTAVIYGIETEIYPFCTPVKAISVEPDTLELVLGDTGSLTVTFEPENVSYKKVIWSSSDEAVATVDANGNITAVGDGIATITATSAADSSKKDTCIVTVIEAGTIKKTAYWGTPDNVAYYFEFELTNGLKIGDLTSLVAKAYAGDTFIINNELKRKGI